MSAGSGHEEHLARLNVRTGEVVELADPQDGLIARSLRGNPPSHCPQGISVINGDGLDGGDCRPFRGRRGRGHGMGSEEHRCSCSKRGQDKDREADEQEAATTVQVESCRAGGASLD